MSRATRQASADGVSGLPTAVHHFEASSRHGIQWEDKKIGALMPRWCHNSCFWQTRTPFSPVTTPLPAHLPPIYWKQGLGISDPRQALATVWKGEKKKQQPMNKNTKLKKCYLESKLQIVK